MVIAPPMMLYGGSLRIGQKIERYCGTNNAEMAIVAVYVSIWAQPIPKLANSLKARRVKLDAPPASGIAAVASE